MLPNRKVLFVLLGELWGFFGPLLRFPMAPIDSRAVPHWPLSRCGHHGRDNKRGYTMSWKTPKITEISVGMEINMYACADL